MNPRIVTILVVAAIAAGSGAAVYWTTRPEPAKAAAGQPDPLAWIASEFRPGPSQLEAIRRLHADHAVVCEVHCSNIAQARADLAALRSAGAADPDLQRAQERLSAADIECRTSIENHVRSIAGILGPEEGPRYLSIVLPRLRTFDHAGPPGPGLEHTHAPGGN